MTSTIPALSIGISIYNNATNVKNAFHSIRSTDPFSSRCEFIVYNDGSTLPGVATETRRFCETSNIRYIDGIHNRGVAYSWNRLIQNASSDIVVILNDDVRSQSTSLLERLRYIFDNNSSVGVAYWGQERIDPVSGTALGLTNDSRRYHNDDRPYIRSNFCGAFFALRKQVWSIINQPDSSTGFWEDLLAYGEELDFSSEVYSNGFFIVQLPAVYEHLHSQTFGNNPEQRIRPSVSSYLSMEEFRHLSKLAKPSEGPHGGNLLRSSLKTLLSSVGWTTHRNRVNQSQIPKLDYSLAMLMKKWGPRSILGTPGRQYLTNMCRDGFPTFLSDKVTAGAMSLPQNIYYLSDDDTPKVLPSLSCISTDNSSLI